MSMQTKDPLLGRVFLGQFELRELIGSGGFGSVYKAYQASFERYVAIKVLHPDLTRRTPQIADRFQREARTAAKLEHRSAVTVFNTGITEDGLLWMAMEFLEGQSLDSHIKKKGRLSLEETINLLVPICEVLQEAHEMGIVHRDLKPDNILLARDKKGNIIPKLLDFGIAGVKEETGNLTGTAQIIGTPQYMSPEHWTGAKNTDARSDIYCMGVIIYQCLSGKLPYEADGMLIWMRQHCLEEAIDITTYVPTISPQMKALILCCLSKKPEQRYQSMHALGEKLQQIMLLFGEVNTVFMPNMLVVPSSSKVTLLDEFMLPLEDSETDVRQISHHTQNNKNINTSSSPIFQEEKKASLGPSISSGIDLMPTQTQSLSASRWFSSKLLWAGLGSALLVSGIVVLMTQEKPTPPSLLVTDNCNNATSAAVAAQSPEETPEERAIAAAIASGKRLAVVGNGTVIDVQSNLMWAAQDSSKAENKNNLSWQEASRYCEEYKLGDYDDWRMPTIDELKELYHVLSGLPMEELEKSWKKIDVEGDWGKYTKAPGTDITGDQAKEIYIHAAIWASNINTAETLKPRMYMKEGGVGWYNLESIKNNKDNTALPVRAYTTQ